ncbi:MAG: tetratricopeptide repeat protein [Bdellovibrionales bacterium]|nr:tetratricopeptide repeat protein [Bdellovibrionales bacterium]
MKIFFILFLLFLTGCGTSEKSNQKEAAMVHLNLGSSLMQDGLIPQGYAELLKAKALDPNNPEIYNNIGVAYTLRKKSDKAIDSFKKALELSPKYTDAMNNLGRTYCDTGQLNSCLTILLQAQNDLTYPYPEKIISNIGYAYFLQGKYQLAKTKYKESLSINPKQCKTFYYYGRTIYELEDFEQSSELFDKSIKLCTKFNFEEPRYFSGMSYLKLGKLDLAQAKFEELIYKAPLTDYAQRAKQMLKLISKAKTK